MNEENYDLKKVKNKSLTKTIPILMLE